jgi:hypothetical protein
MALNGNIDLSNGVMISAESGKVTLGTVGDQPIQFFANNAATRGIMELRVSTAEANMASGPATLTGIIPDGAFVIGVSAVITEALVGAGVTGVQLGDGSSANYWGAINALTVGSALNPAGRTSGATFGTNLINGIIAIAPVNIIVDDVGGTTTAGKVRVNVYYFALPNPNT